MRYPAILAAALGAAAVFATPAAATAPSVNVKYADLDLSTRAGQEKLERRIDSAARSICGVGEIRTGTIMRSRAASECYSDAKARVHQQVAELIARDGNRG